MIEQPWDDEESCEESACLACDTPVGTCCPHCEVHHPPERREGVFAL